MTVPILVTKLSIPPLRENRVARTRLIKQLKTGLSCKLTLVSSPAGFGKTTLLSEFAAGSDRPVAWLSLDTDDNDSTRFLAYLICAIRTVESGFGDSLLQQLQSPKPERIESFLIALINAGRLCMEITMITISGCFSSQ